MNMQLWLVGCSTYFAFWAGLLSEPKEAEIVAFVPKPNRHINVGSKDQVISFH